MVGILKNHELTEYAVLMSQNAMSPNNMNARHPSPDLSLLLTVMGRDWIPVFVLKHLSNGDLI